MDATGGRHMDPATATKRLGEAPAIDPSASLRDTRLGRYCEVGARTKLAECVFGDYSYVANDSDIIYATLGRFCSIAAQVRINPGNHPLERVALNHFTYRSAAYGLGDDDADFFGWRRDITSRSATTCGSGMAWWCCRGCASATAPPSAQGRW